MKFETSLRTSLMSQCSYPKPKGWYCTREEGHEGPCAAWRIPSQQGYPDCDGSDPERCVSQEHYHGLQKLIEALEAGGYEAASTNLQKGEPLKVESLEATMKCVRFDTEDGLLRYARWCVRAAKVARFFRLYSWMDLFLRAEGHFLADAQHARITLHRGDRVESSPRPA